MKCARVMSICLVCLGLGGCGTTNSPAETIKPKQLTATTAMGGSMSCDSANDEAELLVVDLPASKRGDMEIIMSEGLAAVKYDCNSLKLFKACRIEGGYAYKGMLLKEELIRLENSDEVRANLPLSGASVAAKMGGELERGATLDLAVAMVGQQRAARYEVARDELKGRCDGATHFVQSVYVGAFAMRRGERAKVAASAEVFGVGGGGGSSSDSSSHKSDGNIKACRQTKSDATNPQSGCGALLRLYLLPISPAGSTPEARDTNADVVRVPSCPAGMTRMGGKCVKGTGVACGADSPSACEAPCDSGDATSCAILGVALRYGKGLDKSREAAAKVFSRGCELGSAASCYYLSKQYRDGKGVTANSSKGVELADRGCALGSGRACFYSGRAYMDGAAVEKDEKRGFAAYEQGCAAGDPNSCTNLGKAYSVGKGVASDVVYSFKLYLRACEGGSAQACFNVGVRYSKGKGTVQDPEQRLRYYLRACHLGHGKGCYKAGKTLDNDEFKARACQLGYDKACK